MNLLEFMQMGGQARRRMLDDFVESINLESLVPPNLRPVTDFIDENQPVNRIGTMMQQSDIVFDPQETMDARMRAGMDMGIEMAMTLTPIALVRMGYMAAPPALAEVFALPVGVEQVAADALSDVKYATRSLAEGDFDDFLNVFRPSGTTTAVGADVVDDRPVIVRDGSLLSEELSQTPNVIEYMTGDPYSPMSNTTNIKSQKPTALSSHTSVIRPTGEGVAPVVRDGIDNLEGQTVMAIVGDNSGRHDILSVNDLDFSDDPIRSYAGFEFVDIPNQAYAGDKGPTSSKLKEAARTDDPYFMTVMMGEKSGDFAMHNGEVYGRMFAAMHDNISPKDYDAIDESIRNMGAQIGGKTVYPYKDFPSVRDPNALREYIAGLPSGGLRGEFLKGLDKGKYQKWGLPKVSDARLAVADTNQLGMDWGTMGMRGFVPDLEKGIFATTPDMSTTYQAAYDKIGDADTYLANSRGIPANLLMADLSEAQRLKSDGARGGLLMDSAIYKQLEMSPKVAKQKIEPINVDTVNTFLEVERTQGRDVAYAFAQKVLSGGKVTNALIKQARKMNAPQWVIAAMVSQQALQEDQ